MKRRAALLLHRLANRLSPATCWLPAPPSAAGQVDALHAEIEAEGEPVRFTPEQLELIDAAIARDKSPYLLQPGEVLEILPPPGEGKAWIWRGGSRLDPASYEAVELPPKLTPFVRRVRAGR